MGVCGRSEIEAARTTFAELRALTAAYEQRERREWERVRWAQWHQTMLSPYIKPAHKPRTPKALVTFPWETPDNLLPEKVQGGAVSDYERAELDKIFTLLETRQNG